MQVALVVLVGAAAALGVVTLWFQLTRRVFRLEAAPDEIHFAETGDGWRIAVHRYRPSEIRSGLCPVLLCHGIGANALNLDFDDRLSLARYLRRQGFDAWVLELRGRGMSVPARPERARTDFCFDEYVAEDARAAIAAVRRATGAAQVHWVGFSLGGLVGYALLSDPARSSPWARPAASSAKGAT
jgi:pimeloyl-ACP methyl ester carboxylesterase